MRTHGSPGRPNLAAPPLPAPMHAAQPLLNKLLLIDRLKEYYERAKATAGGRPVFERLLEILEVGFSLDERDLKNIPPTGPVVAVANHPFGMIEGAILAALLPRVRPDIRIMTNYLLPALARTEIADKDLFLWVDPFRGRNSQAANVRPLREAAEWVRQGGMLAVFPAGEVAHLEFGRRQILDSAWSSAISGLIRLTGAAALPVYFHGANSVPFQVLGLLHPALRTIRLPHELFNKRGKRICVRIGSPVNWSKLSRFDDARAAEYLYRRTYLLANRSDPGRPAFKLPFNPGLRRPRPVADPIDPAAIFAEVEALPSGCRLVDLDDNTVYATPAAAIPAALREIGRLREIAFRAVGEGSGRQIDLDGYDHDYEHLFVWNRKRREIAGAYRLGRADTIVAKKGLQGLYTNTLFEFAPDFFEVTGPALELGRSFVRPEYQKDFAPLLLLWRGIGTLVARSPQYAALFGPVSISNAYRAVSKQFMVRFLQSHCGLPDLERRVRARNAFRLRRPENWELEVTGGIVEDIDELSGLVSEIEPDRKGVPILIKQYLKLGGRLLEFNVDPKFSSALDGLVVVDLRKTDPRILQRYLGRDGAHKFRAWHGLDAENRGGETSSPAH